MSQLRPVNLLHEENNNPKIKTQSQVKDYEEEKANIINQINSYAALLQKHNEQIAPIVESYKRRTGQ